MMPLVSVIIPAYQHAAALPHCLDALFAQDYPNIEVIVVNDGSTDATEDVLRRYADRISVITQSNQGGNPARNNGFRASRGEYVIFADADVIMRPTMLSTMVRALEEDKGASLAYCSFRFGWKKIRALPWNPERLRTMNFIHTTSLIRREDFPGFDNSIRRFQDWDVWLTMLAQGKRGVLVPGTLFRCLIEGETRVGSKWLPAFVYRLPWRLLPWLPRRVATYEAAREVIRAKHQL